MSDFKVGELVMVFDLAAPAVRSLMPHQIVTGKQLQLYS